MHGHMDPGERNPGEYLHDRVQHLVRGLIEDGTLGPGDRVPSLRALAARLGVSLSTVTRAYAALEEEGWIEPRPQSGFYVRTPRGPAPSAPGTSTPRRSDSRHDLLGLLRDLLATDCGPANTVTLSLALPSPELLPVKALERASGRVLRRAPSLAAQYSPPAGIEALRRQIAYRGVDAGDRVHPEEVIVTSGCAEALAIALRASLPAAAVIAVESPTFFNILTLIETLGMEARELPTDPGTGMDLDALERELDAGRVQGVLTVANFNNPLGSLMPDHAKERLAGLARRYAVPVIEDDLYGELYFGERRPPAVRAFDRDGHVLTASSFSKTIAPGYRVGWLLPGRHAERARTIKHATSMSSATLPQMAIAEFLEHGAYDRHLNRVRRAHRANVARMRMAVAEHFPEGTRISDPAGGFVLWVELPAGVDGVEVYRRALDAGVRVAPGVLFSTTPAYAGCLRLSSGARWDKRVEWAVRRLGAIVEAIVQEPGSGPVDRRRADPAMTPVE